MAYKVVCLLITLLVGSLAYPLNEEEDMSFYFDDVVADPFIIGGTVSEHVPHMVALSIGIITRNFMCGGSIVNDRHVLTAAHCIRGAMSGGSLLSSLRAKVGSVRQSAGGTDYAFSHHIVHPDYNSNIIKNDIGFLITSSSIIFDSIIQPIALSFEFVDGNVATVVNGWGRNVIGGPASQILMELRPFTVDGQQCVEDVARRAAELNRTNVAPVHPEVEICTFLGTNRGMCHGDSGSALVNLENNQQIGVVSWGLPCALGAPDMFARISAYQSWIQQILR